MNWYKIIKDSYESGLYSSKQVDMFVEKGKITAEQANAIKGGVE